MNTAGGKHPKANQVFEDLVLSDANHFFTIPRSLAVESLI